MGPIGIGRSMGHLRISVRNHSNVEASYQPMQDFASSIKTGQEPQYVDNIPEYTPGSTSVCVCADTLSLIPLLRYDGRMDHTLPLTPDAREAHVLQHLQVTAPCWPGDGGRAWSQAPTTIGPCSRRAWPASDADGTP